MAFRKTVGPFSKELPEMEVPHFLSMDFRLDIQTEIWLFGQAGDSQQRVQHNVSVATWFILQTIAGDGAFTHSPNVVSS